MNFHHTKNNPQLLNFAKTMRQKPTDAEHKMWQKLSRNQIGFKFRRQYPVDNKYIVDFICIEKKLIIEVDGSQHIDNEKDILRTKYLNNLGYRIIRFWDNDVLKNINACLNQILVELNE
ncbi:MAG: DUF559 domain-containing protein [Alphaproteobacteria bacterium]|nr:DUF559 domain-containing protein [Alphaproteobacteria bacterium]